MKGSSNPRKVAGAIAAVCRERDAPVVSAIGAASIHRALISLLFASGYLKDDGFELVFRATLLREVGNDAVRLELSKVPVGTYSPPEDCMWLKVGSQTVPFKVAGALAHRMREKTAVGVIGLGRNAVKSMVKAAGALRQYVADDKIDVVGHVSEELITVSEDEDKARAHRIYFAVA